MESTALLERLHKARTGLVMASPFFGTLALRLNMKVDPNSKTAFWVDGTTVGVHPEMASELPLDELESILARATLHAALGHPIRRAGRDNKRWSEACAHVANHEVVAAGMHLPQGSPMDPQYKGLTAEQVYAQMEPPEDDQQGGGKQPSGNGQQDAQGSGGGQTPTPDATGPQGGPAQAGTTGSPGSGSGPDQGGGQGVPDSGTGEVVDAQGDPATLEEQSTGWQEAVAQATQLARSAGNLPGSLERAALNVIDAKVSWREALQRFFKSRAKDDHSWMRPNRRYIQAGLYLPSLQSIRMGTVAVALDLSASITQKEVDQFISEIRSVQNECSPERVVIIPFDTNVRRDEVVDLEQYEDHALRFHAGGGTNFKPAVAYLDEQDIVPDALVYLTDLDCRSFPDEPQYPVLWVTTNKTDAPFGEVIELL